MSQPRPQAPQLTQESLIELTFTIDEPQSDLNDKVFVLIVPIGTPLWNSITCVMEQIEHSYNRKKTVKQAKTSEGKEIVFHSVMGQNKKICLVIQDDLEDESQNQQKDEEPGQEKKPLGDAIPSSLGKRQRTKN